MTILTPPTPRPRAPRATSADELLEFERRRALHDLARSTRHVGRDLVESTAVGRQLRRRPLLATGVGAVVGVIAGRVLLRLFEHHERSPRPSQQRLVPALVLASLRLLGR
jgi:hypothetical protein